MYAALVSAHVDPAEFGAAVGTDEVVAAGSDDVGSDEVVAAGSDDPELKAAYVMAVVS